MGTHGEFYTELDIIDLARAGQRELRLGPADRMTDLARERAQKEGIALLGAYEIPEQAARQAAAARYAPAPEQTPADSQPPVEANATRRRVRRAVVDKLGGQVDPELLNRILDRVLDQLGIG